MENLDIDLTNDDIPSLSFTLPSGKEMWVHFKKRLTVSKRQFAVKVVGKGRQQRDVIDVEKLIRQTVASIEGILVGTEDGTLGPEPITDMRVIVQVLDSPDFSDEITSKVLAYGMGASKLDEDEGNF